MSILAVFVLDYSTLRMVRMLEKYGDRVVYMDTDSIFLSGEIDEEIGDEIGQFKDEGTDIKCWFFNWKRYVKMFNNEDWEITFSGTRIGKALAEKLIKDGYIKINGKTYYDAFHNPKYGYLALNVEEEDDEIDFTLEDGLSLMDKIARL